MAHGCQQKRPESAPRWIGVLKVVLFEQAGEELLSQIAGIVLAVAPPANEHIYGVPIQPAQFSQSRVGRGCPLLGRRDDQTPRCGLEFARTGVSPGDHRSNSTKWLHRSLWIG